MNLEAGTNGKRSFSWSEGDLEDSVMDRGLLSIRLPLAHLDPEKQYNIWIPCEGVEMRKEKILMSPGSRSSMIQHKNYAPLEPLCKVAIAGVYRNFF